MESVVIMDGVLCICSDHLPTTSVGELGRAFEQACS